MFSGLVYYADCGSKLHFATCKSFNGSQDHYRCAKYKSNTGSCTAHFIREEVLKQIVWCRIFDVTALFFDDIMAFHEMMYQQRSAETEKEMKRRKREVGQARKRIAEFDRIFKRIYEDDISGAISYDRFLKLSAEYEAEQRELEEKVKVDQHYPQVCGDKGTHPRNCQRIYQENHSPCAEKGRRETGTESGYCFQLCGRNQFPFCHATETARRIRTRKGGTAHEIGAIPPNLKLLPSNCKHSCLLDFLCIFALWVHGFRY